jgi:pimeloyl-ACP methyl ester carboxylesterase
MRVEFPHVEGVTHRFVDASGLRVHVAEAGPPDGEPVMLVHGWPQHWYEWRGLVPALSQRYRMLMPDLRGLGWTEVARDGYAKHDLARDLVNVLDALELERVKLVAHDWGGYAGFLMCLLAPERVERYLALNINHPWPSRSPRNLVHIWRLAYQIPLVAPWLGPRMTRKTRYVELALRRGGGPGVFSDEELEAFAAPLREPERAWASSQYYRSFWRRDFPALSSGRWRRMRLTVPTLMLFGTGDFAIHRSSLAGYERHADDMRIEFVEGVGHFIADARPQLVAERALEFFGAR